MKELNFSKRQLSLKGLKEMFITDMENGSRNFLKYLLNQFMEIERDEFIDTQTTDLNPELKDYRNGYYERTLRSNLGLIENLRVPRTRNGMFLSVDHRKKQTYIILNSRGFGKNVS